MGRGWYGDGANDIFGRLAGELDEHRAEWRRQGQFEQRLELVGSVFALETASALGQRGKQRLLVEDLMCDERGLGRREPVGQQHQRRTVDRGIGETIGAVGGTGTLGRDRNAGGAGEFGSRSRHHQRSAFVAGQYELDSKVGGRLDEVEAAAATGHAEHATHPVARERRSDVTGDRGVAHRESCACGVGNSTSRFSAASMQARAPGGTMVVDSRSSNTAGP